MAENQDVEIVEAPSNGYDNGNGSSVSISPSAEEVFRGLWASVFYSSGNTGKSVLLCSADSREGTSTIASGMAVAGSLPTGVSRVALVDFNLRRPNIHRIFGLPEGPGVTEMVLNGATAESAAHAVSRGLDVFSAGAVNGATLDVLRSSALPGMLQQLNDSYDQVLIDAPAVNQNADALVLSTLIPDSVLVTYAEKTPREAVAVAKKRLEAAGTHVLGVVLNLRVYPIPRFLYRRV